MEALKLLEGEEGIDYMQASEEMAEEEADAHSYGMNRIDDAYRKMKGLKALNNRRKVSSIAEWRQRYKRF